MRVVPCLLVALIAGAPLSAQPTPDIAAVRGSLVGNWTGKLEYLDYGANKWFGLPVKIAVEDGGDGATIVRRADFDDGPRVGNVRITTVELFDAAKASLASGTFRKGRTAEITTYVVRLTAAKDATHWTMVEEAKGSDDDRPATMRLTTVRDGDALETLKEVDFLDDAEVKWLTRNRTRLTRVSR